MSFNDSVETGLSRPIQAVLLSLLIFFSSGNLWPPEAIQAEPVVHLTPDVNPQFLGPYLSYLEDPNGKLTIKDASSQQMLNRFVRHNGKVLNLGLNSHAYWIRFTVEASGAGNFDNEWLMYFGWPNVFNTATLYIPQASSNGWLKKDLGNILPHGINPKPNLPSAFLPKQSSGRPLTFYLRVESSESKVFALQILTNDVYQEAATARSLWFGVYYGIFLAMLLYNLILLVSLQEFNRLYYLLYLISMGLLYLTTNGLLSETLQLGTRQKHTLVLAFVCLAFFWGNVFAKSFLNTAKYTPFFDKLLSICIVYAVVLAAMLPFFEPTRMNLVITTQSIFVPPIFLMAAYVAWRQGFGPARFFLLAFATLGLTVIYEALAVVNIIPYLTWTRYSSQAGSAVEVILLQLALADRIKALIEDQERTKQSLSLAREVQQNLLPHDTPRVEQLDIAGKSVYCDETGGDYYDFIAGDGCQNGNIGIAIGDVSGHGISSALLMATVRSSLRQRSSMPGDAAGIISDVNRQLSRDVEDSGQFMTMFYLEIDPQNKELHWVRAGHDPAIFYDPKKDSFQELGGSGIALGVMEEWEFEANKKTSLQKGHIVVLCTDGIWEACNLNGEMFGKEPIYNIIREYSGRSATEILDALLASLDNFQKGAKIEDDVTVVVVKINH